MLINAQTTEPKPVFKSALLNRLAKSSHQARPNPQPPPKNAFVDGGESFQQKHSNSAVAPSLASNPTMHRPVLASLPQPVANGSGTAVSQDVSESSSSEELEDEAGGDGNDNDESLVNLAEIRYAESAVAVDVDAAALPPSAAWIDLVPVADLAASLDMSDPSAFGLQQKHLQQARLLSQSLLTHFGSGARQMLLSQRFIWPIFKTVLRPHTLTFSSDDANQAFGQLLLAESSSKVCEGPPFSSANAARHAGRVFRCRMRACLQRLCSAPKLCVQPICNRFSVFPRIIIFYFPGFILHKSSVFFFCIARCLAVDRVRGMRLAASDFRSGRKQIAA